MAIAIARGFDNLSNLVPLADASIRLYDPRVPSNAPARVTTLLSGHRVSDGYQLASLVFDAVLDTTRMRAVLEAVGLRSGAVEAESAEITIALPGQDRDTETWNALIYHPHAEFARGRFGEMAFTVALVAYLPRQFDEAFSGEFE